MLRTNLSWLILPILCIATQALHAAPIDSVRICGQAYIDSLMQIDQTATRPSDLTDTTGTTHVLVHFTTSGKDASTLGYAKSVALAAESSWAVQVGRLSWHQPPSDNGLGGDPRLDFYIRDTTSVGFNYQGQTAPDPSGTRSASSWITIAKWLPDSNRVRFAVAHEFNHACQNYYNKSGDSWFRENTSQWITKYTFPSTEFLLTFAVNYASFSESPLGQPFLPITRDQGIQSNYEYAGALWPIFLSEWKDSLIIRRTWEMTSRTNTPQIVKHIDSVLVQYYSDSLRGALCQYAIWRCFTGAWADTYHFKHAFEYLSHGNYAAIVPPYSQSSLSFKPTGPGGFSVATVYGGSGTLNATMDGQDGHSWAAFLIGTKSLQQPIVHTINLNSVGYGTISVPWAEADTFQFVRIILDTVPNPTAGDQSFSVSNDSRVGITFLNSAKGANAGGKHLLDNVDSVTSGQYRLLSPSTSHDVRTLSERFITDSTYKHHDWNGVRTEFKMNTSFVVQQAQLQAAQFRGVDSVKIRNEIIGATAVDGGTIQFRDPWQLNSGGVQPDSFFTFNSPLSPTGAYNQSAGGVFLNQGDPINLQPPYYSVKAPLTLTIGAIQCTFVRWDTSGATLVQVGTSPQGYDQKAVIFRVRNAVVKAIYQATSASIVTSLPALWNVTSIPIAGPSIAKSSIYPTAASDAFTFVNGVGYVTKDSLMHAKGYWVKYTASTPITYTGTPLFIDSVAVAPGWNMIGSLSAPLPTTTITAIAGASIDTKYYMFSDTYHVADTLKPGFGYWVKTVSGGKLLLNNSSTANVTPSTSAEVPPELEPSPPPAPVPMAPADLGTGIGTSVAFDWEGNYEGDTYHLQVDTDIQFATPLVADVSVITENPYFLSGLAVNTTYYWRIRERNNVGEGDWATTASFTTTSGMTLSWTSASGHPNLAWTVPSGMTTPYKVYRYFCACGEGDCLSGAGLIASTSSTSYTDASVNVQGKFDPCASVAYYFVKGTLSGGALSGSSNKVTVNDGNISEDVPELVETPGTGRG